MEAKERAIMLYKKHTKEYNRMVVKGTLQKLPENKKHWEEVTRILTKLYQNEQNL
jgi:hypothetical protein